MIIRLGQSGDDLRYFLKRWHEVFEQKVGAENFSSATVPQKLNYLIDFRIAAENISKQMNTMLDIFS